MLPRDTAPRGKTSRVALIAAVLGLILSAPHTTRAAQPAESARQQVVIAVLPFTDSSPDGKFSALAEAIGDMVASFLGKDERVVFVERVALDKVLQEQALTLRGLAEETTCARVGRLLGAKYVLSGGVIIVESAKQPGASLRVNAHLLEVETTRVARAEQADGSLDDLVKPVSEIAQKLGRHLELKLPEIKESDIDRSPVASLHFMRGLGYYYANMRDHAIAEFMKCLALKRDHASARYWNGVCYLEDKEYEHAKIEFDRFLRDFPQHELARDAGKRLAECERELAKEPKENQR